MNSSLNGGRKVRIAIGSDHEGLTLKAQIAADLKAAGHEIIDAAPSLDASTRSDYSEQVALSVLRHDADRGVVITGRAVNASVTANRVPGIRAAVCGDAYSANVGATAEGMNLLVLAVHGLDGQRAIEIAQSYTKAPLAQVEVTGGLPPRRLQRVLSHVGENIGKDLTVAELAQVVGMSQYYFSKLFKMSTGTTPHQYVMRQRVERAQELLRERQLTLVEIATNVGFETQSHFTSVFRRLVGITPKRFRDMRSDGSGQSTSVATIRDAEGRSRQGKSATAA